MAINKIKKSAEVAKAKTNDKRWINAIDKAVAGVESGWWIITELAHGVAVTTETGSTYFANGVCQCKAFEHGQPCKHRALARLVEIAATIEDEPETPAVSREEIIAHIEKTWPKTWPPLAVELMARFGVNSPKYLADDMLRAVRLAVSM
jgi:hypothetical protein